MCGELKFCHHPILTLLKLFLHRNFRQENLERRRRDTSTLMQLMNTPNLNIIKTRSRRSGNISLSSPDVFPNTAPVDSKVTIDDEISRKDNETNTYYKYFYAKVNASVHTFTLKQLKHYTYYSVSVKAVRAGSGDNSSKSSYRNHSTTTVT